MLRVLGLGKSWQCSWAMHLTSDSQALAFYYRRSNHYCRRCPLDVRTAKFPTYN